MSIRAQNLPWTESPFFEHELAESALSDEDKAFAKGFAENGYAIFDPGLSESLIDELNTSMAPSRSVAMEDITPDNGPLHYYPGSHKLPFYDMIDLGVKASDHIETKKAIMAYAVDYTNFIQEMIKALELKKQTLNIKKGQAMIWSANLLHGGEKINTPVRPASRR